MLSKHVLLTLLAACGVHSSPEADRPPDTAQPISVHSSSQARPPEDTEKPDGHNEETVVEGQHFCCGEVDGKGNGDDCILLGKEELALCNTILYCSGSWQMQDKKVKCIE